RLSEDLRGLAGRLDRLRLAPALIQGAADELDRLVDIERLGQVFISAALERRDRAIQIRVRGHDDDRHRGVTRLDRLQQLQPRLPGHADIRDQDFGRAAGERVERLLRGGERAEGDAFAAQRLLDHPADRAVVVDDPDGFHDSGRRILNSVRPGRESNSITPWWYWTKVCASESPKPVPPCRPETSGLKILSRISSGTPGPSSATCNSNASL